MHSRFWEYVVQFYPMWVAPNVITISGFFINLVTVLILACFSYDAKIAVSLTSMFIMSCPSSVWGICSSTVVGIKL